MIWRLIMVFMLAMSLGASATEPTSAQRLAELVEADDQFARKSTLELSTLQGDHRFSREWTNYTRPAYDARRQHAEKMLAGLQQIDVPLSPTSRRCSSSSRDANTR